MALAAAKQTYDVGGVLLARPFKVRRLGHTGDAALVISGARPVLISTLRERHESWFPDYMSGANA